MGWVDTQLVDPLLHFHYFGFSWIEPLGRTGMYSVFILLAICSITIALGLFYRISAIFFFLAFTYVELIDITYYLNHYYFVSIISFLLIWLPANRDFSIDVLLRPNIQQKVVSSWCINVLKLQIAVVYTYAGLAKINYDWLIRSLPLSIWLPAKTGIPLIGWMFKFKWIAAVFSWAGMIFDTFIISGLLFQRTRVLAYMAVVVFHTVTGILFQIGVFPLVMIGVVLIFFPAHQHEAFFNFLRRNFTKTQPNAAPKQLVSAKTPSRWIQISLAIFVAFQLLFPWRYLLYDGNLFWTEQGYRFSWRVMLMEKAGTATFYVKDGPEGREGSVINRQFLNDHQEKQMAMQPDLILQFAHYLSEYYQEQGMKNPQVRAEAYVTLNGSRAQLLINPNIDLAKERDSWVSKDWILPFDESKVLP